jgi:hypothetical protein
MQDYFQGFSLITKQIENVRLYFSEKKIKAFEAVEAIHRAANQTRAYFNSKEFQDGVPNIILSELWLEAAKAVRKLDDELYNRLLTKANFWSNPKDWTEEMVAKAKIFLDDIIEDSKIILQKKKVKK